MAALRRFRLALAALLAMVAVGVIGYVWIEGWSVFDALYMTISTLSTTGIQSHPLSPAGQTLTMVLIVTGLSTGAVLGATVVELAITALLGDTLRKRRMLRELSDLRNHYILCGWGRMGQEIGEQFRRKGLPCVVIELNEEKCRSLGNNGYLYVHGDASDDATLKAAGIRHAAGLISVAPTDAHNIFITLSARALNKQLYIVARSIYDQDVHKLELAGANRVVSPYVIGARRIASAIFHPSVSDFLDANSDADEAGWEIEEIQVSPNAPFVGQTFRESAIRERTGCTVLAVREAGTQRLTGNPPPETVVSAGDLLVVVGTPEQLRRLRSLRK
jgi:voltage-gated potassium channel